MQNPEATSPSPGMRLYRLAGYVVVAAIVGYLVLRIIAGREALGALDFSWNIATLAASAAAAIAAYQALFLAWLMMLRRAGFYRPGRTGRYARVWWTSFMYRYVPGKVLLVIERARLGAALDIPISAGATMPVIETLLSVLAGAAVSLLALGYYLGEDGELLAAVGVIAVVIVFLLPAAYRWISALPWIQRRFPDLETLAFDSRDLLLLLLPFLAYYLLLGVAFFLLVSMLHPVSIADLPGICGVFALSHVVGILALFAPGGLGVREGALAIQLGRILPAGVTDAVALGARAWLTAVELLCFVVVLACCPPVAGANTDGDGQEDGIAP